MKLWQSLLVGFGGNAALFLVIGYFGRSLMMQVLAKDVAKFKANLQIAAVEHQVRFSKLHKRRAEVLAELYKLLVEAIWETSTFTSPMQWEGDPEKRDQYVTAMNAITKYFRFFDQNRIWLATDLCNSLEEFAKQLRKPAINLSVYLSIEHPTPETAKELSNVWSEAWNSVENDIPKLRQAIEGEFRSLLDAGADKDG